MLELTALWESTWHSARHMERTQKTYRIFCSHLLCSHLFFSDLTYIVIFYVLYCLEHIISKTIFFISLFPNSSPPNPTPALFSCLLFLINGDYLPEVVWKDTNIANSGVILSGIKFFLHHLSHVTLDKLLNVSKSQFLQLWNRSDGNLAYRIGEIQWDKCLLSAHTMIPDT